MRSADLFVNLVSHVFRTIVRRLLCYPYIVDMALSKAGAADLHKLCAVVEVGDCLGSQISHTRSYASEELVYGIRYRTLVGNASFDPFRNKSGIRIVAIPIAGAFLHGRLAAHASIVLIGATLIQDDLARRFFRSGK